MRIVAVSDLHRDLDACDRLVAAAERADLVIGAGDFADKHEGLGDVMARLEPVAHKAIHVPGNNERLDDLRSATSATVLHGGWVERGGLVIAGLGAGVPPKPSSDWPSWDLEEEAARALLDAIPAADILISHSPPYGMGDDHGELGRIGSQAVKAAVLRLKPRLCLFGHVHDGWGERGTLGPTEWRNLGPAPVTFNIG